MHRMTQLTAYTNPLRDRSFQHTAGVTFRPGHTISEFVAYLDTLEDQLSE